MTTTKDQEALDAAALLTQTLRHSIGPAIALAQAVIEGRAKDAQIDAFAGHLARSERTVEALYELLVYGMGAASPAPPVHRDELPLHLCDTPATRALLEALRAAKAAAKEVDRERGWVDEDMECIGFTPMLTGMTISLEREVVGAKGGGRE
jgi:hypothetical protein